VSLFRATTGNSIRISGGVAKIRVGEPKVLYYNAATNTDWGTLGNWWLNDAHTQPAPHLPRSIDSVVLTKPCYTNSTSNIPTVISLIMNDPGTDPYPPELDIDIVVIENATFNDNCSNLATITGNVIFNDSSANNYGTIIGDVVFRNNSINLFGVVTLYATFIDAACNLGGSAGTFIPDPPPAC
jgi:hypothetical protein